MKFTASLSGRILRTGSIQDMQMATMEVVTSFLAEDPERVALVAQKANRDFQDGTVSATVASSGMWVCLIPTPGGPKSLTVTCGEEN